MKQENQIDNNAKQPKKKSKKGSKQDIASMGANLAVMMSGGSPVPDKQPDNAENAEIGAVEMTPSSVTDNPPVTNPVQDAPVQNAESAECKGYAESEYSSEPEGDAETVSPVPVEVNINIEKTQGNAIYSSLMGIQSTLDNLKLDVKQDSMKEVVSDAVKEATATHWKEFARQEKEQANKRREEGLPGTSYEIQQAAAKRDEELRQLDIEHMEHYTASNKAIHDRLSELLGHTNLYPLQKPHFMDDKGHLLLNSLYLYPWYCILRVYFSYHVRWFLKAMAWSVWLICVVVLFFVLRDNVSLQKQKEKNKYVHVYFSDNEEVMMELEGIDIMFSDVEVKPVPINDYREYMKERKKALKDKAKGKKRK